MEEIDVAVIGAGVVGLAAAAAVAGRGLSVCVLEREPRPGMGTSTHNSQVIHAGMYYPAGSLKAKHCVRGAQMLYDYCASRSVAHARCGKLIVAQDEGEVAELERLRLKGEANGVHGLRLVDRAFVAAREPHVRASPTWCRAPSARARRAVLPGHRYRRRRGAGAGAGARLPGRRSIRPARLAPACGRCVACGHRAAHARRDHPRARAVVNAAGLYADEVSRALGGRPFRIYPCRGEYVELVPAKRPLVNGLVYPLPHAHGHSLGVHLTKTIFGNVTLGPTVRFQERKDDYEDSRIALEDFLEPARELLPQLTLDDLRLGGSGIRAKLHPPDESFADFLIEHDPNCPRLVQASGIESPGLTSCLSIGLDVANLVEEVLA